METRLFFWYVYIDIQIEHIYLQKNKSTLSIPCTYLKICFQVELIHPTKTNLIQVWQQEMRRALIAVVRIFQIPSRHSVFIRIDYV